MPRKTKAITAEAADERKPPKKAMKKEGATSDNVAAEPVAVAPHPLCGKRVAFSGSFKVKKSIHQDRVQDLGGKGTTNVSSKTSYFVMGRDCSSTSVDKAKNEFSIPVWTEEQFVAVCNGDVTPSNMAPPPPPPMIPDNPLKDKTVVLAGSLKGGKKDIEARIRSLGGRPTTTLSGNTDYVVSGTKPGENVENALKRGIEVWTEEQFEVICRDGWNGIRPPPPVLPLFQPLATHLKSMVDADKISSYVQRAVLYFVTSQFDQFKPDNDKSQCLSMARPRAYIYYLSQPEDPPAVGSFGSKQFAPLVTAWPGDALNLEWNELEDPDVANIFEAIAARNDNANVPPLRSVKIIDTNRFGDKGMKAVAELLPRTKLQELQLCSDKTTKVGVKALLAAVEKTPTLKQLHLNGVNGGQEVYNAWKQSRNGTQCGCNVDASCYSYYYSDDLY